MSPAPPDPNTQTGVDMANARAAASIEIEPVSHFLYGSELHYAAKHKVVEILSKDPAFDKSQRDYLTRTQRYQRGMAMTKRLYELEKIHGWSSQQTIAASHLLDEALPLALHTTAFTPVFSSQSRGALAEEYVPLAQTAGIFGAYLQTELAHGSNVSKLETTATYIPETKEFEIHSPSLTAAKWWIGALGRTATHGVVQARLLLPSPSGLKDFGPHLFFVQLRSLDDHKPLPGIKMGDIGPKVFSGFSGTDNGFAVFDHVRIPKSNMLDKFSQVTDSGEYVKPPHAKISYGGMLYIRSNMVTTGGWSTARGVTVALRYCHVRRQGEPDPANPRLERQVITYPSVYYRLLPALSRAYVWLQLGRKLVESFEAMNARLAKGDASLLAELHATTSGLKTLVTTHTINDLETSRRSMGGHGYSAYSGLGRIYADSLPSATFEGDNFVLDQQVVRAALKTLGIIMKLKPSDLSPSTRYLRLLSQPQPPPQLPSTPEQWRSLETLDVLLLLLEWRAALVVKDYAKLLKEQGESSVDASAASRVSKAVTEAFVAAQVRDIIVGLPLSGTTGDAVKHLYILYLLTTLETGLVDLLAFGLLPSKSNDGPGQDVTHALRLSIKQLCLILLPNAIALSDAFAFSDWELDSALGVYNGKAYQALWDRVKEEPLNLEGEITPIYKETIRPLLERGRKLAKRDSKL